MSVVRVDPAYTSLTCSRCGVARFDAPEQERNRIRFRCPDCGDVNRRAPEEHIGERTSAGSLCGRISYRRTGQYGENQRRRYLPSVRKTALVRSVAPQGASC